MSQREICSLAKPQVVTSRLRSGTCRSSEMESERQGEVARLKALLEKSQAVALEKERQLVNAKET